jgi:hypothetical protein
MLENTCAITVPVFSGELTCPKDLVVLFYSLLRNERLRFSKIVSLIIFSILRILAQVLVAVIL